MSLRQKNQIQLCMLNVSYLGRNRLSCKLLIFPEISVSLFWMNTCLMVILTQQDRHGGGFSFDIIRSCKWFVRLILGLTTSFFLLRQIGFSLRLAGLFISYDLFPFVYTFGQPSRSNFNIGRVSFVSVLWTNF